MRLVLWLAYLLANARLGTATTFWSDGDPGNPDNRMGCTGRIMDDSQRVAAHPTLPCRTLVWVYNLRTRRSTVVKVMDRGPRHALVDLSPAAAAAIGSNGMETVLMVPVGPGRVIR